MSDTPNLTHAGMDVTLAITTDDVAMISMDNGKPLISHSMEEISFASGGDSVSLLLYTVTYYLYFLIGMDTIGSDLI